jgi:hypothetical protein
MRVFAIPDTELQIAVESFPHQLAMESFFWWFFTPSRTNLRWETFILNFFTDGSIISHTRRPFASHFFRHPHDTFTAETGFLNPYYFLILGRWKKGLLYKIGSSFSNFSTELSKCPLFAGRGGAVFTPLELFLYRIDLYSCPYKLSYPKFCLFVVLI